MSTLRLKDLSREELDELLADRKRTLTGKQRQALVAERDRREAAQAIPRDFGPSDCPCGDRRPHTHFGDQR